MKNLISLFFSGIMVVVLIFTSCYNPKVDSFALDEDSILHITNDTRFFEDDDANIVIVNDIVSVDVSLYNNIIIDKSIMGDSTKIGLHEAFLDKKKIIVVGEITENEVREYFGLEKKIYTKENRKSENDVFHENNMVDVSKFKLVGQLIYKNEMNVNIIEIKVEDVDNLLDIFKFCFKYNYSKLINSAAESSGIRFNNSWSNVAVKTATYSSSRATIVTALVMNKNDGNPNSNDQYLSHIAYAVESVLISGWYLDRTDVEVRGRQTSLVYSYGSTNMTNPSSSTISFSLPWGINVSFTPGAARLNISRIEGGIDSNNFKTRFNVVNFLGLNAVTSNDILAEANIQSYQPSSGYFFGYGQFNVRTNGYQGSNPLTYYNGSWDSVSGS